MTHTKSVIDHIAGFTGHRDKELLDISLLKSIQSMIAGPAIEIVSLTSSNQFIQKSTLVSQQITVSEDIDEKVLEILPNIEGMRARSENELTTTLTMSHVFIKLLHDAGPTHEYLVVYLHKPIEKALLDVLQGMFTIYINFIKLLTESQTDELTGLANRKTFEMEFAKIFDQIEESVEPYENERRTNANIENNQFWLAIIDIDNFKLVNDTFGHLYGDEILIQLGQLMRQNFRSVDRFFRFGGEEFVVMLRGTNKEEAFRVFERFRKNVASHTFPQVKTVTISIGAVEIKEDLFQMTLIDYADQALYESKRTGKNKLTFFEDMVSQGIAKVSDIASGDVDLF